MRTPPDIRDDRQMLLTLTNRQLIIRRRADHDAPNRIQTAAV